MWVEEIEPESETRTVKKKRKKEADEDEEVEEVEVALQMLKRKMDAADQREQKMQDMMTSFMQRIETQTQCARPQSEGGNGRFPGQVHPDQFMIEDSKMQPRMIQS